MAVCNSTRAVCIGYPIFMLVVFCVLFFPLAWWYPQWLIDHEPHADCTITAKPTSEYDMRMKVTLRANNGVTYTNVTAGWDMIDRPIGSMTCNPSGASAEDNLGEKLDRHIDIGDKITCWIKKDAQLGPNTPPGAIRAYIWPELLKHCWIRYAMASWIITGVLFLLGVLLSIIYICSIADRPASDAYQTMQAVGDFIYKSQMLIWMAIAFIIFLGAYFGVVFPMIADKHTCRLNARGRRIEGLMAFNTKDGSKGPQSSCNWCSRKNICHATLMGDGTLYRAWVDVDYAIDNVLYSAVADWDVRGSQESLKTKLFAKGKKDRVAPFLADLPPVGATHPCYVTRYSDRVYLRDPSQRGSYRAALICSIFFFIFCMLLACCACMSDHMYPWL